MKQYFILFVIFGTLFIPLLKAQTNTQHSQLARQFLAALNSNELAQIERFVVKHFSPASLARWNGAGKNRYVGYSINQALFHGHFSFISSSIERSNGRTQTIMKVKSRNTDMHYNVVINFNDDNKQPVTGWYINEDLTTVADKPSITEAEFVNQVEAYANKLANNGVFSGTVLLAKGNEVLLEAAHGFASRRYDVKNNIHTKFQIGSMNKMFTSVAILQLAEAGQLSLSDKITTFVDRNMLGKGDFDKVKIHHLLTHTSGINNLSGYEDIQNQIRSLNEIRPLFKSTVTTFEPGSQWQYSGAGMILLGLIIENLSGKTYYEYINENIYKKAGMVNSGSFDLDIPIKNTARNYWFSVETGQLTENLMFQSVKGDPSGGGYSTVNDLHKFAMALQTGTLLNKQLAAEALSGKPELSSPNYGYGFSVQGSQGNQIVGHNGAHLGMSARLNIYQDKGYTLAILGNYLTSTRPIVAKVNQLMERL